MWCGIGSHNPLSHQHHHRFLHSFRSHSHKSLGQPHDSSSDDMSHCHRRPSDASSLDRSPRRPSTSTTRSDLSVDWDSLRLHPPLAPGPAPPLQDAAAGESFGPGHQPHRLGHARSSYNLGHQLPYQQHSYSSSSHTVIYDGFDFGFDTKPTPAVSRQRRRRDPSPAPSDASSASSRLSGSDESLLAHGGVVGLAPPPPRRSRPGPRPRPHASDLDEPDFFIRRGGWKRHGIVFVNTGPPLAGEDETFEI